LSESNLVSCLEIIFPEMKPLEEEENFNRLMMGHFFICSFFKSFMYTKNDFSEKVFNLEWYEKYSKEWLNSYLTINQKKNHTVHSYANISYSRIGN